MHHTTFRNASHTVFVVASFISAVLGIKPETSHIPGKYPELHPQPFFHAVFQMLMLINCQCSDSFQSVTQMFWFTAGYVTFVLLRINCLHPWWSTFLGLKITVNHFVKWYSWAWQVLQRTVSLQGSREECSPFQCDSSSHWGKNNEMIRTKLARKFSSFLPVLKGWWVLKKKSREDLNESNSWFENAGEGKFIRVCLVKGPGCS